MLTVAKAGARLTHVKAPTTGLPAVFLAWAASVTVCVSAVRVSRFGVTVVETAVPVPAVTVAANSTLALVPASVARTCSDPSEAPSV